jgi:hypothetical protein
VIDAATAERRPVTHVWHPEAVGELLDLGAGVNARVATGDPAYQVSDGEIVNL